MMRLWAIWAMLGSMPAWASDGDMPINLITQDGEAIEIGTLALRSGTDGIEYDLALSSEPFGDHFLSMRPFKCIDRGVQTICHLPYPYPLKGQIAEDDFRDLEYRLMFLFKAKGEYGISFENGYIFKLRRDGDGFVGTLHEADMNQLASPPPKGVIYPFGEFDLFEVEGPWIRELRIGG